jgi:DNA-binding SARP family transcriptional activator
MAPLNIRLLGGFEARAASGVALPPLGRKARALLGYLALAPGRPQPRDRLAALLWSDRGEAQARTSLRQALSELRKALAAADPPPLEAVGDGVALAAGAVEVDAAAFERLIDDGGRASLEAALALYRGDLLDGLGAPDPAFEEWLREARRRLRERAREAMTRLLDLQLADGAGEAALATARRLLDLDPLQESAHRAVMRIHAARGERALALKQYRACREVLRAELGVEPEDETERLHEEIRARQGAEAGASATSAASTTAGRTTARPERPAVAVLPFVTLSDEPQQAYFADGMTRALITELGRMPTVAVVGAATMFAYQGRRVSVAEVARDLGVRYVLDGGLQASGRRFRVTAQLTDAQTGQQVWGERFDGELGDILEAQDSLTREICGSLYMRLLQYGALKARHQPLPSADGYDLYMRAHHHIEKPTPEGLEEARGLCRRVLDLDPEFALAYETLMWTDLHAAWNGWVEDPVPALDAARCHAEQGFALGDADAYLHGAVGFIRVFQGEFESGLEHSRAAFALAPSDAAFGALCGGALSFAGRLEEALEVLAEAEALSPGYHVTQLFQGDARFLAGQPEAAARFYERFLGVLPGFSYAWLYLAACQFELGRPAAARDAVAKIRAASPAMTARYLRKLLAARDPSVVARLLAAFEGAGLPANEG